jgi:ubiquitin carboxyl-terminal hydrolase 25
VWIRDFKKRTWYKYNDSLVTEDVRDSQAVLDELNKGGDPYYVAYVRDENKEDLVEVPQRGEPENGAPTTEDVEMQIIEGVAPNILASQTEAPDSGSKAYITSSNAEDEPPPYEIL